MDWNYNGHQYTDIQSIVLNLMGHDGSEKCDEIIDPVCTGTGLDYSLCKQHPEAHFVWFAITHWAHFLNKLQTTLTISALSVGTLTHDLVTKFYTPETNPTSLIMPVSIAAGFAAMLSAAYPPAAIAAGVGGMVNGILTQSGLSAPKLVPSSLLLLLP